MESFQLPQDLDNNGLAERVKMYLFLIREKIYHSFLPQTIVSFIVFAFIKKAKTAFSTSLRVKSSNTKVLVFMIF